jgi:hypothetical protein
VELLHILLQYDVEGRKEAVLEARESALRVRALRSYEQCGDRLE